MGLKWDNESQTWVSETSEVADQETINSAIPSGDRSAGNGLRYNDEWGVYKPPGVTGQQQGEPGHAPGVGTAADRNAYLTREQYKYWEENYLPLLRDMVGKVTHKTADGEIRLGNPKQLKQNIAEARGLARDQRRVAQGITERNMAAYGMDMTPEREMALRRSGQVSAKLGQVDAAINTRRADEDRNERMMEFILNTGRDIEGGTKSMFGSAADMESSRNAMNKQASAQNKANWLNLAGTLAGMYFFAPV